jgi:predicted RNase H-like HicB family nuclease
MSREEVAAMTRRKRYVALYERDRESDAWLVHIDGIEACQTYGRTLRQAGERIEEALALWLDRDPDEFVLDHEWPQAVNDVAAEVSEARTTAAEATQLSSEATIRAARLLTRMGLSRRDTAEILGISHQRVQQLLVS